MSSTGALWNCITRSSHSQFGEDLMLLPYLMRATDGKRGCGPSPRTASRRNERCQAE